MYNVQTNNLIFVLYHTFFERVVRGRVHKAVDFGLWRSKTAGLSYSLIFIIADLSVRSFIFFISSFRKLWIYV